MAADFAVSWEQRKWEAACQWHAFYSGMLESIKAEALRLRCKRRLEEIESEYPTLKQRA